jgi:RNA polymerase sigma factor (sigma-70 family)
MGIEVENIDYPEALFQEFSESNPVLFNQPVIISFFSKEENKRLLTDALIQKDKASKVQLDKKFSEYYQIAKTIKYLSNLIYFYSIDFDKRIRKYKSRYLTVLDKPMSKNSIENESSLLMNLSDNFNLEESISQKINGNLEQYIQDENVLKALKMLSMKQRRILELIYIKQLKHKEIALIENKTPQSISQLHKHTLKKLKEYILREE